MAQSSKAEKQQYGFIMVMNKESTKLYYSPVFAFVDKRGNVICNLREKENYDVMTSDYFDSREEADQARKVYMDSEKKAGRIVIESEVITDCNKIGFHKFIMF